MDMATKYFVRDGYLFVKVCGSWTGATAKRVIDDARREAERLRFSRILFDLTDWTLPDTEFTRFESGEYLSKVLPVPFKIAAFALPNAINKFGEDTAVNRGAQFRIFADEGSAVQWLMK